MFRGMPRKKRRPGLLDELARKSECAYLSELRDPVKWEKVCSALSEIPDGQFALGEWNEAVFYLAGIRTEFESVMDARCALQKAGSG